MVKGSINIEGIRRYFSYLLPVFTYFLLLPIYKILPKRCGKTVGLVSRRFGGNIKCLYEEMKKYNEVETYFITAFKEELERAKLSNVNAYYDMDLRNIPLFLRTDIWVTDNGPRLIPVLGLIDRVCTRFFGFQCRWKFGSKWIDVWHAGHGFKDVGREQLMRGYDLMFVTSKFFQLYYSRTSGNLSKLKITGNPRMDPLFKKAFSREEVLKNIGVSSNKKNILYAPTRSHEKKRPFFPWEKTDKIIEEIEKFCRDNNCNFLVRMHPWFYVYRYKEAKRLDVKIKQKQNIFVLSPKKFVDVQSILYITDILITDWSSIANDFIILDRPIIFLDVEFPVTEFKLTPENRVGYIVRNKKEFFEKLKESIDQPLMFEKKRKALIKKLYKHLNGNSTRRCAEEIIKLLKEN